VVTTVGVEVRYPRRAVKSPIPIATHLAQATAKMTVEGTITGLSTRQEPKMMLRIMAAPLPRHLPLAHQLPALRLVLPELLEPGLQPPHQS